MDREDEKKFTLAEYNWHIINNLKEFNNKHIYILGNPRASQAKDTIKDRNILKTFSLDPNIKTVVCFMGSLGSESVNKVLEEVEEVLDIFKISSTLYKLLIK